MKKTKYLTECCLSRKYGGDYYFPDKKPAICALAVEKYLGSTPWRLKCSASNYYRKNSVKICIDTTYHFHGTYRRDGAWYSLYNGCTRHLRENLHLTSGTTNIWVRFREA